MVVTSDSDQTRQSNQTRANLWLIRGWLRFTFCNVEDNSSSSRALFCRLG
jgi:hypothetical protein